MSEEDWRLWAADRAASPFALSKITAYEGFEFESAAKARLALAAIKMRWASKRPLFDWEQKALAAGWNPPKGWTGAP